MLSLYAETRVTPKPESLYPETNAFKAKQPSGSGNLAGNCQDTPNLVSLQTIHAVTISLPFCYQ
jgi:hypothetical protein